MMRLVWNRWLLAGLIVCALAPDARAQLLIGVSFGGSGPTNWTTATAGGNYTNLIDENGNASSVSLNLAAASINSFTPTVLSTSVPQHTPSLSALSHNLYSFVAGDSLTATFSGLTPNQIYTVYAFGLESGGNNVPQAVTITGAATTVLNQTLNNRQLWVNGSAGSSSQSLESYGLNAAASNTGTIGIKFQYTTSAFTASYTAAGVAISAVPEPSSLALGGLTALAGAGLAWRKRARNVTRRHA
ncbi:MAG: PEP-CTERM sorting domain-containing protein [Isosphaeraceae bacterium]